MHKYVKGLKFEDVILSENDHYIIINKPPYISTLEDRNDPIDILKLAKRYLPDCQVCHRLDKETSGVLVVAKHKDAYRHFSMLLENRQVKKIYHTVVDGIREFKNLEVDAPIYSSTNRSKVDFREGKPSLTLFSTLEIFQRHTLLKCFPVTGRLHQIRVHAAYHDAPVCGDPDYGGKDIFLSEIKKNYSLGKWKEERPLMERVALHAHQVAFQNFDSSKEEVISIEAPYPKDFQVLIKQLRKYT